jgi:hypothetical protein
MQLDLVKLKIPVWGMIILFSILILGIFGAWYLLLDEHSTKMLGFVGGVVSGLVVFLFTYATVIGPTIQLDRYKRMGIVDVLSNRHDKEYYKKLVSKSRTVVRVMGASCTRFVEDFLDPDADDKVLFDALLRYGSLKVELLVPTEKHLAPNAKARTAGLSAKLDQLEKSFPGRVLLKRFDDKAHHSFVIVDDELVAGPIFEGDMSRHAPAVHVKMTTTFGMKYSNYFDDVWKSVVP